MLHATPAEQNHTDTIDTVKSVRENSGFIEISILSLVGLTVSLVMIAQGIGPSGLQVMLAQ
jgi:hypothetical protein